MDKNNARRMGKELSSILHEMEKAITYLAEAVASNNDTLYLNELRLIEVEACNVTRLISAKRAACGLKRRENGGVYPVR